MSSNLHLQAEREISFKNGLGESKTETQTIFFENIWQTPTEVTKRLMYESDILSAFIDWVLSISTDKSVPIYSDDDIWQENEPKDYCIINEGEQHIERLNQWIKDVQEQGYTIKWEAW